MKPSMPPRILPYRWMMIGAQVSFPQVALFTDRRHGLRQERSEKLEALYPVLLDLSRA